MQTLLSSKSFGVLRETGATALLFATLLQVPLSAWGWIVHVENPYSLGKDFNVSLHFNQSLSIKKVSQNITRGTSHDFDTGGWCPQALQGDGTSFQSTNMYGGWIGDTDSDVGFAPIRCANVNVKICYMPKESSKTYSFCPY